MARRLALELTNVEARALLLTVSESRVHVEKSLTLPLAAEAPAEGQPTVEQKVVEFLNKNGISRVETLAVVGRADIELRLLSVPPSPDDELPGLVRFQAAGEFANLDADAMLDYLPLDEPAVYAHLSKNVLKIAFAWPLLTCVAIMKPSAALSFGSIHFMSSSSGHLPIGESGSL